MKLIFNILGCVAVILAVVGIFLPLLPTTPFLLLASACFLRGSERMHRWLIGNRWFGKYLSNVQNHKGMPMRGKLLTLGLMWGSLGTSMFMLESRPVAILLILIGAGVTYFILRMKTLRPDRPDGGF